MDRSLFSKSMLIIDLAICTVWILLMGHGFSCGWTDIPFYLLFPLFRIWVSFAFYRRSKIALAPIIALSLFLFPVLLSNYFMYILFVEPGMTLMRLVVGIFEPQSLSDISKMQLYTNLHNFIYPFGLICCIWLLLVPIVEYAYRSFKKQLHKSEIPMWRIALLCLYIFVTMLFSSLIMRQWYKVTITALFFVLMVMLVPSIFKRSLHKSVFNRYETVYLVTFAMFIIGYLCAVGLELKTVITVCAFPAAFLALINWFFHRKTSYRDIVIAVSGCGIFWYAQYATGMTRIMLLFVSLALMAVPVIHFFVETRRKWTSIGLYIMIAVVMPVFFLGYNPYSVLEAGRCWHFNKYLGSPNGLLYVRNGIYLGLRDRFGVILPVDKYTNVILLNPYLPYCKVKYDGKWQIYDIERKELVSEEMFRDVVPCGENVYRLKTEKGCKYLIVDKYYHRNSSVQTALITEKIPEEIYQD